MRRPIEYYYFKLVGSDYRASIVHSDPYDQRVKGFDDMLHEALSEIFRERRSLSSDQIKELLADQDFIIKLILEKNRALSEIFPRGNKFSILSIALLGYYRNSAELLVRSGANVNECCLRNSMFIKFRSSTPLHLLLQMYPSSWIERLVTLVIDNGADMTAENCEGQTALKIAIQQNQIRMIELLLEKGAVIDTTDDSDIAYAICYSDKANDIVPLLIKYGVDVTVRDVYGSNALHYVSKMPDAKQADLMARFLIEKGVSLNDRSRDNKQPLHEVACFGKNELVELFLDHGADVNARDIKGKTPIFYAARCDNPAVLLTLLNRGANVDLKMTDGSTVLHQACMSFGFKKDNWMNIKTLLFIGIDMCVENNAGYTALSNLIQNPRHHDKNTSSIRLMLKTLAIRKDCLQPLIELKDESIIEQYPELWTYYQDCVKDIRKLKSMRLIHTYTMFDFLKKCPCQFEALLHNVEFEKKFRQFDLEVFSATYAEDTRVACEHAELHYSSTLKQEDVINEAVHNILPWEVVRKVARYTVVCEKCKFIKFVKRHSGLGN